MNMNIQDLQFIEAIQDFCEKKPHFLPKIIYAGTAGVKAFAENQRDVSSHLSAILIDIILANKKIKCGMFTKEDIKQALSSWFGGTKGFEKLDNILIERETK